MTHQVFSLVAILAKEEYYCACGKCYVTGAGASIYYVQEMFSEITVMLYLLSSGLTFQMWMDILIDLYSHQINLAEDKEPLFRGG